METDLVGVRVNCAQTIVEPVPIPDGRRIEPGEELPPATTRTIERRGTVRALSMTASTVTLIVEEEGTQRLFLWAMGQLDSTVTVMV